MLPQATGTCDAAFFVYWHDPKTGVCEPFVYGGCEGNDNRFDTREACEAACQGGTPDMDACASTSDCVLATPGCCAACDPVDARAFVGINRGFASQYQSALGCGGGACGACPAPSESERTSQYFTSVCDGGHCAVLDVRESPVTACAEDADCILRDGIECCEGCDGTGIVAINRNAHLEQLVCGSEGHVCPACVPRFPPGMRAVCSMNRCRAAIVPPPGGAAP